MWGFLLGILGNEVHALLPGVARWLVRRRAATLPADLRDRLLEEWLAEVDACASHFWPVIFAAGLWFGRSELLREHRAARAQSGASTQHSKTVSYTWTHTWTQAEIRRRNNLLHDPKMYFLTAYENERLRTRGSHGIEYSELARREWTQLAEDMHRAIDHSQPKIRITDVESDHSGRLRPLKRFRR